MERMRYFCDTPGGPIALKGIWPMANAEFALRFPGVAGLRADGYSRWAGYPAEGPGGPLPVTRRIDYKAQPSLHLCNAKCLNGKATGSCECRCGGRNHGRGVVTGLFTGLCAPAGGAEVCAQAAPLVPAWAKALGDGVAPASLPHPVGAASRLATREANDNSPNDNLIGATQ